MISFADMMKKQIVMPAHLMNDGQHSTQGGRNLFKDFSSVAQTTGTYTGQVCFASCRPCQQTLVGQLRVCCCIVGSSAALRSGPLAAAALRTPGTRIGQVCLSAVTTSGVQWGG